jgi:uncharacterized protein YdeI (YjbR/CyaY-like superfamily)
MQISVDKYLIDGCMRCKYGGTPQCKVHFWTKELETLRHIVLKTDLEEEIKWGIPVYTLRSKNILSLAALKDFVSINFFKGVLLNDGHNILEQQANLQSDRRIIFTNSKDILEIEEVLISYIKEAIALEESGKKVVFNKSLEPLPVELLNIFEKDTVFKSAFLSLTQGRQRGYIIYFSQPKQQLTRIKRIEKYRNQILEGVGLHDKYNR